MREQAQQGGFHFHFDGSQFKQGAQGFRFEDFQNFQQGNFQAPPQFGEVEKAKEFFGFTHTPTKEEVKKKYKELARKYHPDINDHDDSKMKDLNHYKDVLMQIAQ